MNGERTDRRRNESVRRFLTHPAALAVAGFAGLYLATAGVIGILIDQPKGWFTLALGALVIATVIGQWRARNRKADGVASRSSTVIQAAGFLTIGCGILLAGFLRLPTNSFEGVVGIVGGMIGVFMGIWGFVAAVNRRR